jgi:lysophosphatidate acyltransferase
LFINWFLTSFLVLPPIDTKDVKEESADVEKLANKCRDQMLEALKDITPPYKKTQ